MIWNIIGLITYTLFMLLLCNYNNFNDGFQASLVIVSYLIVLYGGIYFFIYNFLCEIGFIEFLNTLT